VEKSKLLYLFGTEPRSSSPQPFDIPTEQSQLIYLYFWRYLLTFSASGLYSVDGWTSNECGAGSGMGSTEGAGLTAIESDVPIDVTWGETRIRGD
jgi:hypothetical protein